MMILYIEMVLVLRLKIESGSRWLVKILKQQSRSRLPADRAGKALSWLGFHRPKCVDTPNFFYETDAATT